MSATSTTIATQKKTVSSRHALLEELIGIAVRHAGDQYLELANKLAGALIDATDGDTRLIQQRIRAGNLLRNRNFAFLHLATSALGKALRREIAELAPTAKPATRAPVQALSLVSLEEMDNKVALGGASKPFESLYADALQTLNVRLAFLLERDILRMSQNPFRPAVFLAALQQAWLEFDPEEESNGLLQPWLKPGMFIELAPMLEALSLALQSKGVLPGSVDGYQRRKADGGAAARPRPNQQVLAQQLRQFFASSDVAGSAAGEIVDGIASGMLGADGGVDLSIPDLPASALAAGNNWAPNAGQTTHGQVVGAAAVAAQASWPQGPARGFSSAAISNEDAQRQAQLHARQPLLTYLAELQKAVPYESIGSLAAVAGGGNVFYLPNLKQAMPEGSLSRADESTIDLLSAVFDTVFRDQSISPETRELIRFLQIPVLKAALVDKNFFFQEAHPARRLLELLSRMGWEQRKGPDDPLFQAMQRSVDRVGRDYDNEMTVFTEAVNELEAQIQAEEKAAAAAIAAPIAAALKQEKVAESNKLAKNAVALRIGTGEVIAIIEAFLEQRWVSVLTIAYSVEDDKPGAVNNATKTMDDLIWSVRPKFSADDRKQLIARLPGMLSALNKWLDVIKWQDADRLRFFAELAECHASIVRAPIEMSAERQVEIAMQVARQAAERRLALQAQAAAIAPVAEEGDEAAVEVDSLTRGMWLAFEEADGGSRKVKLAWISPRRTLYIFSTAARQEAFSLSGDELLRRLRAGSAQVLHAEGVVAVALSQALSRGAHSDAGTNQPAAG
ncbi:MULTISPECIES: DUF1631 family protein [unclassified Duganella]|uniref:DUF1631 family protein n=1 Tax=unclassified Duganella TaxID=2636909 RepID=UPI00089193C9|nr:MULTISPECIES: DUF1631 family protein [unclassified Duganella]SDF70723.1 Protein of unknown function [Duganella sp. OV458]SDI58595.1 Protein of unknown function [Duganella sp. OV510]